MPLLRVEAERLSNNFLESGVITEIIDRDQMLALLPFVQVNNKAYVYNREKTLPGVEWLDPNDAIAESAATFEEVVAKLRILAGDVDVDNFLRETMGDTNDQLVEQIAAKSKAINRQFHICVARGDTVANSKQFDGLPKLVTSGQTILAGDAANGAAIALTDLDELKDLIPLGADAFIMRSGTRRAVLNAMRLAGGTTPPMISIENFNGAPVLAHDGVPILVNDFLAADETTGTNANTCSVYAVRFNESDGLVGLYGGSTAGVRIEEVGTVQNKDAIRIRVKWYVGLALKSTKSIARLKGVTNI
jgi:hypothetical protein